MTHIARRMQGIEKSLIRQIFDIAPPGSLNLGLGEPGLRTPPEICDDAIAVLRDAPLGYTPHAGIAELRRELAAATEWAVDPEQVCVTVGSQEALSTTFFTLLDSGDEILVPDPGFVAYPALARLAGATPVSYPLYVGNGFHTDPAVLERLVTPRTRAILLNSPSNPTGAIDPPHVLDAIAALADERGIVVISDEAYRDIYFGPDPPPTIGTRTANAVVLRTFSKSFAMTGWRIGWTIAPPEIARAISVFHGYSVTSTSVVSQRAAHKLLAERDGWPDFLVRQRGEYRRRLEVLQRGFAGFHCPLISPEGAFYALLDLRSTGLKSVDVAMFLVRERKVTTVPGLAFGERGEGYLRLSFAGNIETLEQACPILRQGIEELAAARTTR